MKFEAPLPAELTRLLIEKARRPDLAEQGFEIEDDSLAAHREAVDRAHRHRPAEDREALAVYHCLFDRSAAHCAALKPAEPEYAAVSPAVSPAPAKTVPASALWLVVNIIKILLLAAAVILLARSAKAQGPSNQLIISTANGGSVLATRTGGIVKFKCDGTTVICSWSASLNTFTLTANGAGGGATPALDNLASVSINTSLLAQTGVDLGSTTAPFRNLYLFGSGTFGSTYHKITGTPTSTRVWTLPDVTDTFAGLTATQTLTNKTLTTPTIASFTNATHDHSNAAGGGTIAFSVLTGTATAGQIPAALSSTTSVNGTTIPSGGVTLTRTVFAGTKALATTAISSAACSSAQTVAATGTLTTDVVSASFNGDPTAVTGYVPLTAGMLTIIAYPTADTVNFKVCNNTSASITPGAITLNVLVAR